MASSRRWQSRTRSCSKLASIPCFGVWQRAANRSDEMILARMRKPTRVLFVPITLAAVNGRVCGLQVTGAPAGWS